MGGECIMTHRRLVADVGGTWSRFGVSDGPGRLSDVRSYPTAPQSSFAETMARYAADIGAAPAADSFASVLVAAAGPVDSGVVQLTNSTWRIAAGEISRDHGGVPVRLINDLEAVGLLLPHLADADIRPIGGAVTGGLVGNRIAVNVGTGFGAATAIRAGHGRWAIAAGEAGHMSLPGGPPDENAGFAGMSSIEDVLSGSGVVRLHAAVARARGTPEVKLADTSLFASARSNPTAAATVDLVSRLLGRVCGDLVLATASWDGVFLCGSVAKAWSENTDGRIFRDAFEHKGPMSARMARVPAHVIVSSDPALRGLTHATDNGD